METLKHVSALCNTSLLDEVGVVTFKLYMLKYCVKCNGSLLEEGGVVRFKIVTGVIISHSL